MLRPTASGERRQFSPQPYEFERHFETLIDGGFTDLAATYIRGHATELGERMGEHGYDTAFFKAAIKDLAMPMYRKLRADYTGEPYPDQRAEIASLYDDTRELLGVLESFTWPEESYYNDIATGETAYLSTIRGDQSELMFFALMTRSLTGYGDDHTVVPSFGGDDIGMIARGGVRTGYDFTVHDRDTDALVPVQVKTGHSRLVYIPEITVISIAALAESAGTDVAGALKAILYDTGRDDARVSAMEETLLSAIRQSSRKAA